MDIAHRSVGRDGIEIFRDGSLYIAPYPWVDTGPVCNPDHYLYPCAFGTGAPVRDALDLRLAFAEIRTGAVK